jgi:hypothetical protein
VIEWTNIEPLLDLLAFGVKIETTNLGGGYIPVGGTSVSAAYAAGAAALLLEKEELAPLDLQYRLRSTGVLIEHQGYEYPRVDVIAALNNQVTNVPQEQEGTECIGTWDAYLLLAGFACAGTFNPACMSTDDCDCCGNAGDNLWCTGNTCEGGIGCHDDGVCSCNYAACGSVPGNTANCDVADDCGAGALGACENATMCWCNFYANCTNSRNCFIVMNKSANSVYSRVDNMGWMDMAGRILAANSSVLNCKCNVTSCLFIKNSSGACVATFGFPHRTDLMLLGNVLRNKPNCSNITGTGLIIQNSTGGIVFKLSSNGTLCLRNEYHNYSSFS